MTSGIYKLTFRNGQYYIGKSNDITRRWAEHNDKMLKGTAATKMQECYNEWDLPVGEILMECHPDHIDIMEAHLIDQHWSGDILNTSRPTVSGDLDDLLEVENILLWSTAHHCKLIYDFYVERETLKSGTRVAELEEQLKEEKSTCDNILKLLVDKGKELEKLKNKSFFDRLFNW